MEPFNVHKNSSLQVKPGISVGNTAPVPSVVSASHVPYNILPTANNLPTQDIQRLGPDYVRENRNFIFNPRGAPSAVLSENALRSKALGQRVFAHSEAATKYEFISNLRASEPRFRDQVDLLA